MCVESHLGGESKHSNLDTHAPTFHAQTQMEHNSSPPGGEYGSVAGVGESESGSSACGGLHQLFG